MWLMSKANNAAYCRSWGTPSARKDLAALYGTHSLLHIYNEDTVNYGYLPPKWTLEIWNDLDPLEEEAITGRISVKDALDQAATKVDQAIASQQ
jgi:hypothetical protein